MNIIPAIVWELETRTAFGKVNKLRLSNKWRLAYAEGIGIPDVEWEGIVAEGIEGELSSRLSIPARGITIGIFYKGALSQRELYAARRKILEFFNPGQYVPTRLYITLPNYRILYIDVLGAPGPLLPLSQERNLTFLEDIGLIAPDPIYIEKELQSKTLDLGSYPLIASPSKATCTFDTSQTPVTGLTSDSVRLILNLPGGSTDQSGWEVQHRQTDTANDTAEWDDENIQDTGYIAKGGAFTVEELQDERRYQFRARAYNSGGEGAWSDPFDKTTLQYIPEHSPLNFTGSPGTYNIVLSWNALENAVGYQVAYKLASDALYDSGGGWINVPNPNTSITIGASDLNQPGALLAQTGYTCKVRGKFIDPLDSSRFIYTSDEVVQEIRVSTKAHIPPGAVTNLIVIRDNNQRRATWAPPSTGGPVSRYRYKFGVGQKNTTKGLTATGGLGGSFRVRAIGPGGAGPETFVTSTTDWDER